VNPHVQEIWLRLFGAADSSQPTRAERIEEGYYAVVREVADPDSSHGVPGSEDFSALHSFIPNLARTRAVYLNQEVAYGISNLDRLRAWAGPLADPIERGTLHAFAVVDPEVFAQCVCAELQASGWSVKPTEDDLQVSDGQFTESVNPLRAIVQMVLSRGSFAEAAKALKAELNERFAIDAGLFGRFAERFAKYRPTVFDHYFTACPECPCMAAGWDYWQVSNRGTHEAAQIFEQAMKEFEEVIHD
jgi:hypothetical protein